MHACAHMYAYGMIRKQMCAEEAPADAAPDGKVFREVVVVGAGALVSETRRIRFQTEQRYLSDKRFEQKRA